ncbi:MAG: hypothetical protein U0793_14730 [Gemmataceae bacterium]
MKSGVLRCDIEDLAEWHPYLYVEPYVVAFVAVTGQYSVSPARFLLEREDVKSRRLRKGNEAWLEIAWSEETVDKAERLRSTMPSRSLVEMAAVAVALIVAHRVVVLGTLNVMEYGGRADYRSTRVRRVLEVSGTEDAGELRRRQREKVAQALANPYRWDAYVVICAFGSECRVLISGHSWQEATNAEA